MGSPFSHRSSPLEAAGKDHNQKNHQQHAGDTRRSVPPVAVVWPSWNGADQE